MNIAYSRLQINNLSNKIHDEVQNKMGTHSKRRKSKSKRSCGDLIFPVNRIHRLLRDGKHAENIAKGAAVYLTAVIEYLTTEVLCLAAATSNDGIRTRILSRHVQAAVFKDVELKKLLSGVTFSRGHD